MTTKARLDFIKDETITKIQEETFYSFFKDVDETVLSEAYYNAFNELSLGTRDIIDIHDEVTLDTYPTSFMANLTCHYIYAFQIKPYLVEDPAGSGNWIIEDAGANPALFRTLGSQSMDGVMASYESERLGIEISSPIEQWLSTSSWGFRCIQPLKDFVFRKGRIFVC